MTTHIGPYALSDNRIPVLLAPMSGVTDAPFRKQASGFGASVTITEMVAGEELLNGQADARQRLSRHEGASPFVVQLIGREADAMRKAAFVARDAGADIIDINMGCPSRRVTGGLSGSALMRDIDHAATLIEAVKSGAEHVPVTLKMRLGWDRSALNAPQLARRAEDLGVELVTVHGRTRQEFYEGIADWCAIRTVVESVSIPVIANGDITSPETAREALKQSGAAGVMVGRAATGRAWLPAAIEKAIATDKALIEPPLFVQVRSLMDQTIDSVDFYGARTGMKVVRKHVAAAFDYWNEPGVSGGGRLAALKREACRTDTPDALESVFELFLAEHMELAR